MMAKDGRLTVEKASAVSAKIVTSSTTRMIGLMDKQCMLYCAMGVTGALRSSGDFESEDKRWWEPHVDGRRTNMIANLWRAKSVTRTLELQTCRANHHKQSKMLLSFTFHRLVLYILLVLFITLCSTVSAAPEPQECDNTKIPTVTLSNGVEMPQLSLGTAHLITDAGMLEDNPTFTGMLPERLHRSLTLALEAGIRGIDTALIYRTHQAIRQVLADWFASGKLQRSDIFLETKIFHGPVNAKVATAATHLADLDALTPAQVTEQVSLHFEQSLTELGVGYVDLMLLHWPATMKSTDPNNRKRRLAAWTVLEEYYQHGWARAIGVSNFSVEHLQQLQQDGASVQPMVNQIEASVYLQYSDIVEYCQEHGIVVQAYSPLGRGVKDISQDTVVLPIADKHGKNPGQIAMRYLVQLGYTITFLSSSAERLASNQEIFSFELDENDMKEISTLNRPDGSWGLPPPHDMT